MSSAATLFFLLPLGLLSLAATAAKPALHPSSEPLRTETNVPLEIVFTAQRTYSDPLAPQACGVGDRLRAIYVLSPRPVTVRSLRPNSSYRLTWFDPVTGDRTAGGDVKADAHGEWHCPALPHTHDYALILELGKGSK